MPMSKIVPSVKQLLIFTLKLPQSDKCISADANITIQLSNAKISVLICGGIHICNKGGGGCFTYGGGPTEAE